MKDDSVPAFLVLVLAMVAFVCGLGAGGCVQRDISPRYFRAESCALQSATVIEGKRVEKAWLCKETE